MMEPIKRIKGTDDILPPESATWQYVADTIRRVMSLYNYREIITPIFEYTELFARSIGASTDIVSKEMYTFLDMGERSLTLRPEGTASVVRAYVEHSLSVKFPIAKLYYIGPMFRQEKPQKGRKRQFNQFGIEILGTDSPYADVEGIILNLRVLKELGITDTHLMINSIGDPNCRQGYRRALKEYLQPRLEKLCSDCQLRYHNNPLRVFDCKKQSCQAQLEDAPVMSDYLCDDCRKHFDKVLHILDKLDIEFSINERLVRGLDYYTKTVYEITSTALGSQNSLSGGGRYDILVEELGGKPTPAFGFAAGIERIIMAMEQSEGYETPKPQLDYFIALTNDEILTTAMEFAERLRDKGNSVNIDFRGKSLKSQMKQADKLGAKRVVIIGDDEFSKGVYLLRDMETGEQTEIPLSIIPNTDK